MSNFNSIYEFLRKINENYKSKNKVFFSNECKQLQESNFTKTEELISNFEKKLKVNQSPMKTELAKTPTNDNKNNFDSDLLKTVGNIVHFLMESNNKGLKIIDEYSKKINELKKVVSKRDDEIERLMVSNEEKQNYINMMEKQVLDKITSGSKDNEKISKLTIKNNELSFALKMTAFEKEDNEARLNKCLTETTKGVSILNVLSKNDISPDVTVLGDIFECFENIRGICNEKRESEDEEGDDSLDNNNVYRNQIKGKKEKKAKLNQELLKEKFEHSQTEKLKIKKKINDLFKNLNFSKKKVNELNESREKLTKENEFLVEQLIRARLTSKKMRQQLANMANDISKYINESEEVVAHLNSENSNLLIELMSNKKKIVEKKNFIPKRKKKTSSSLSATSDNNNNYGVSKKSIGRIKASTQHISKRKFSTPSKMRLSKERKRRIKFKKRRSSFSLKNYQNSRSYL